VSLKEPENVKVDIEPLSSSLPNKRVQNTTSKKIKKVVSIISKKSLKSGDKVGF
jgi:hypothetical protein